jgi:hypothetical protein
MRTPVAKPFCDFSMSALSMISFPMCDLFASTAGGNARCTFGKSIERPFTCSTLSRVMAADDEEDDADELASADADCWISMHSRPTLPAIRPSTCIRRRSCELHDAQLIRR